MPNSFLEEYHRLFRNIEGWFAFDAALLFMAYNQMVRAAGIAGDVLEIGVHHGLSTIAVASLRGPAGKVVAIDLFDQQHLNVSGSGMGDRARFEQNMRLFYPDLSFLTTLTQSSSTLTPDSLGRGFSFCHIDGGHSRQETFQDLCLCYEISLPGALIVLDDYFNPQFPGVCEGALQFWGARPNALTPVAVGFNKVIFQKNPASVDLNATRKSLFPQLQPGKVTMWDQQVVDFFPDRIIHLFDLARSEPSRLHLRAWPWQVEIVPAASVISLTPERADVTSVNVTNKTSCDLPFGTGVFGLSYHLRTNEGALVAYDNERTYLRSALQPGETRRLDLQVRAPRERGSYILELDMVWEQIAWLSGSGNPTATIHMRVA